VTTAAGPVSFEADATHIYRVWLGREAGEPGKASPLSRETTRQLRDYFAGRRRTFDLPLRIEAPEFTTSVLEALCGVPFGETVSYGDMAALVKHPRAARAVGQAVGANPLAVVVPCHRVLAAGNLLGGFGAGLDWKRYLLELEGITWTEASPA